MKERGCGGPARQSRRLPLGVAAAMLLFGACSGAGKGPTISPRREVTTRYNLARVYLSQGRAQDAIPLLEEVIKEQPDFAEAHNVLGVVYWTLGQTEKARAELNRALEISPYLSDARVNLGVLFSEQGDYERARVEFERALQDRTYASPEKPLVNLAVNDIKLGRADEALSRAEDAIQRNPLYVRAYDVFVEALGKSDPQVAGREYRTLVRALDESQEFHFNLGNAFLDKDDQKRALYHFERVVDINPSSDQAEQARKTLDKLR